MGNKTFLLADNLHINEKNFESLLAFCFARDVDFVQPKHKTLPIDAFGDYAAYRDATVAPRAILEKLAPDSLFEYSYNGISVFEICRVELVSFLIAVSQQLRHQPLPKCSRKLFEKVYEYNYIELIDNMAAGCLWIDFWRATVEATPRLAYVGVFSGSLTYTKTLLEVMRFHPGRCFVLESFFTGKHYYCEERYTPISNDSDIRLKTVYQSILKPINREQHEIARNRVRRALQQIKNKNVTQPSATGIRLFNNGHPTLLVLGQVLNDFSLLETKQCGINSLEIYRQLIRKVIAETEWNVIFKAHPWERKKHNLRRAFTKDELNSEFENESRVALVEDHALSDLLEESEGVLCLNSQSGIEAALAQFVPIQLGNSFWGGNGFSHDIDFEDLDAVIKILAEPARCRADLDTYERLESWLVTVVDAWLVEEAMGAKADKRLKEIFYEIGQRTPIVDSQSLKAAKKDKSRYDTPILSAFQRKLRKLINRPTHFFRDMKKTV